MIHSTAAANQSNATDPGLAELIEELSAKIEAGEPLDLSAYLAVHAEHAAELRRLFPALRLLANFSRSGAANLPPDGMDGEPVNGVLGDFRLLREVGRGGMGVVYEAEQISLGRRVALKVLPYAGALDAKQLQRFKNEAKAAASLKHEHIVQVHAIGCERGVHFYAMEFIDGQTLAQVISSKASGGRKPPENETADFAPGVIAPGSPNCDTAPIAALSTKISGKDRAYFRRSAELIADAADALEHAHSLGIVHRDIKPGNLMVDAAGKLWVADFGLARFGPDAGLTMTGDLLGTLRYMAPEQALAKHGLADHRVDLYGLGCTLYELLAGKPPVRGTDKADILRHIAFEEPITPRKVDKTIPAELETIALKCLAKNPNERYASAGDLAADLRRFLEDKPIKAKPPGPRERAVRWVRRNRALAASVAVTLIAGALMAAGSFGYVVRDRAARLALTEQKATASLAAAREAITAGDLTLAGRKISEARGQIGGDGEALPEVLAEIGGVQADIDNRQANATRFQRFMKLSADAQDRIANIFDAAAAGVATRDALAVFAVSETDEWLARLRASTLTADQQRQVREMAYLTVVSLAENGVVVKRLRRPDSAARALDHLRLAESFHEPTRAFYFTRSFCHRLQGNVAAADEDLRRLIATAARTAWDYRVPGSRAMSNDHFDEAIDNFRSALAIEPDDRNALYGLAWSLEKKKEYAEAAGVYSGCLALNSFACRADVYAHRSFCYRKLGRTAAAAADLAAALDPANYDPEHNPVAALDDTDRFEEALTVRRRVLALRPNDARGYETLGENLVHLGRNAQAEAAFRRAIELKPDDCEAHVNLGWVLDYLGRPAEAEAEFRRAIDMKPDDPEPLNLVAWYLATASEPAVRDPQRAVELATKAVAISPGDGSFQNTLGVAHYRARNWKDAIKALDRSLAMESGGNAFNWFFLAMSHWQLGNREQAVKYYAQAVEWMEKNQPKHDDLHDLRRFRAEAAELLGVKTEANGGPPTPPEK